MIECIENKIVFSGSQSRRFLHCHGIGIGQSRHRSAPPVAPEVLPDHQPRVSKGSRGSSLISRLIALSSPALKFLEFARTNYK
jgi:hypothetical protein